MNNKWFLNHMYTGFGLMIFGILSEVKNGFKTVVSFIIVPLVLSTVITLTNREKEL